MTPQEEQAYLREISQTIAAGPYRDDWQSLFAMEIPGWFSKAKFGIFIHWGLCSVPAHNNEWYSRNMYIRSHEEWKHQVDTYGKHTEFGYKDFIPLFTAEKFDPDEWMELFRDAGAKYVFPVAEHHDGFQMYKSELSHWNAYEMGPHRDILGELRDAAERAGITFCTSSHRAEHWWFMGHGKEFPSDVHEPLQRGDFYWPAMPEPDAQDLRSEPYPTPEYLTDWLLRTCEIIDRYHPALLYFDWWIQHEAFKPYLKKVAAYYYNRGVQWGQRVAICYKHDAMAFGTGIVEVERGALNIREPFAWQTDTAIAKNSWCYTDSLDYKSPGMIIRTFVETIVRGGNMLLNVGPKADGTIPEKDAQILREIGGWMRRNASAIYGTKPWRKFAEGPTELPRGQFTDNQPIAYTGEDIRFLCGGGSIYAFVMQWPSNGRVTVKSLATSCDQNQPEFHGILSDVQILGFDGVPSYMRDERGLHVCAELQSDLPVVIRAVVQ